MARTPEVVPRRQGALTLAQIAAAVLSGAAAMYGIQSYTAPLRLPGAPHTQSAQASGALAPEARKRPALSEPLPVPKPPILPRSSMLVKKEPGGAPQGVLAGGIDDPARTPGPLTANRTRLTPRSFSSGFGAQSLGSDGIGRGFTKTEFRSMFTPSAQSAAAKRSTRLLDKTPLDPKDLVAPSGFRPEDAPEPAFWTEERVERVAGSGLVALIGLCYLFFTSGAFAALRGKKPSRDDEEPAS